MSEDRLHPYGTPRSLAPQPLRPVAGVTGRRFGDELTFGVLRIPCTTCLVPAGVPCAPGPTDLRWYGVHPARLWTLLGSDGR